jgi:hypothetical protein
MAPPRETALPCLESESTTLFQRLSTCCERYMNRNWDFELSAPD